MVMQLMFPPVHWYPSLWVQTVLHPWLTYFRVSRRILKIIKKVKEQVSQDFQCYISLHRRPN